MGKFILGFIVSTVLFMGFALMYANQEAKFVEATCDASSEPSELYLEDDADRALVCKYLRREVGLDQ